MSTFHLRKAVCHGKRRRSKASRKTEGEEEGRCQAQAADKADAEARRPMMGGPSLRETPFGEVHHPLTEIRPR
jgi:hypothetical protein